MQQRAGDEWRRVVTTPGTVCHAIVAPLTPGRPYAFRIAAVNDAGVCVRIDSDMCHAVQAGEPSIAVETVTASAAPLISQPLAFSSVTSHSVAVAWVEPECHGAPITEYRLAWGTDAPTTVAYTGPATAAVVKGLQPATLHCFRLQASNRVGTSSGVLCHVTTPAAAPAAPTDVAADMRLLAPTSPDHSAANPSDEHSDDDDDDDADAMGADPPSAAEPRAAMLVRWRPADSHGAAIIKFMFVHSRSACPRHGRTVWT